MLDEDVGAAEWLTPSEASKQFGYSLNWLRTLRLSRVVEARQTRFCYLFSRSSLAAYKRAHDAKHAAKK